MSEETNKDKIQKAIENLESLELEERQEAAWNLHDFAKRGILDTKQAMPQLVSALGDDDWAVRKMSIMALGYLNAKEAIPKIKDILRTDLEPEVRVGAATALAEMKVGDAVPLLIDALKSPSPILRQVVIWALGTIGKEAKKAIPILAEILLKPEDIEFVQENNLAAWALGEIGDPSAIEPLKKALQEAAYAERKFTIAYSLNMLEGKKGIGYKTLMEMKENNELEVHHLELIEKMD